MKLLYDSTGNEVFAVSAMLERAMMELRMKARFQRISYNQGDETNELEYIS
jgi:hypothetical protein